MTDQPHSDRIASFHTPCVAETPIKTVGVYVRGSLAALPEARTRQSRTRDFNARVCVYFVCVCFVVVVIVVIGGEEEGQRYIQSLHWIEDADPNESAKLLVEKPGSNSSRGCMRMQG